jgi:hypothetical protein
METRAVSRNQESSLITTINQAMKTNILRVVQVASSRNFMIRIAK